jgi:hypothetical protein
MIVPSEKALAAVIRELTNHRLTLMRYDTTGTPPAYEELAGFEAREALIQVLRTAIPHLVDTGQPAQCSADIMKRPITETCECGHMIGGLHRVVKVLNHDPITVCDPCLNRDEQPPPITTTPSIQTRLDGLLDVVLRMEQRVVEAIQPIYATTALEVDSGPTDYEVWRDALTLACRELGNHWDNDGDMLRRAEWWVQKLRRGSIDQPDGVGDQIARGIQEGLRRVAERSSAEDVQTEPRMGTGND